jgi:hypothetical protein
MNDLMPENVGIPPLEPSSGTKTPPSNESLRAPLDPVNLTVSADEESTDAVVYTIESSGSSSVTKSIDVTLRDVVSTAPPLPVAEDGEYEVLVTGPKTAVKGRGPGFSHVASYVGDLSKTIEVSERQSF